ncbi:MAG: hypothetical protein EAZ85_11550 [Bacteroidetes bacterium]|nr:MAG: hypothetical protein EAZ85_11550 [Bacteroidota bacterium]
MKKYLIIISLFFSFFIIFCIFFFSKEYFLSLLVENLSLQNKKEWIKKRFFVDNIWQTIQILMIIFLFLWNIFLYFWKINIENITFFIKNIIQFYTSQPKKEQIFFIFFLILSIFPAFINLFFFPYLIDEVFAYTFLLQKGFLGIYPYYPGPNQHILFHLGSYFFSFTYIFSQNPILYLRFFTFFGFFLSIISVGFWVWKRKNIDLSVISMLSFAYFPPILVYSFLGRGYSWQIFFTILQFYFLLKLSKKEKNITEKNDIYNFILVNVLGMCIIPTHLFVIGSAGMYLFFRLKLKKTIFIFSKIFLFTALFYLPVLFFNGFSVVLQNNWVKSLEKNNFFLSIFSYIIRFFDYLFADFGIYFLVIFIFFSIYSYKKINIEHKKIIFFYILFPILFCFSRFILPPERVFSYFLIGFLYIFIQFLDMFDKKNIYLFLIIPLFFLFFHIYLYPKNSQSYQFTKQIIEKYSSKKIKVFANQDEYQVFFRYFCLKNQIKIEIETQNFDFNLKYNYVIFDKKIYNTQKYSLKNYQKIFENDEIIAFDLVY